MIMFAVLSFIGIKIYGQSQTAQTQAAIDAKTAALDSGAASGSAPGNGRPASPAPDGTVVSSASSDDDSDDGAMASTVLAVYGSLGQDPDIMPNWGAYDTNQTQDDSGADNHESEMWRRQGQGRGKGFNRILDRIWGEALDVDYMCSQPGVAYRFHSPGVQRQDWNPGLNNQPWARNTSFKMSDPTSVFETADDGITPDMGDDGDDGMDE